MDGSSTSAAIRTAGPEDFAEMIEMGARMHAEGRNSFLPYNREKLMKLLTALHQKEMGFFLLAERGGRKAGMLLVYLSEYFFCDEKIVRDLVLWVEPGFRGGLLGKFLVEEAEKWAKSKGAIEASFGVTNGGDWERVGTLYERLGYSHDGDLFRKRL